MRSTLLHLIACLVGGMLGGFIAGHIAAHTLFELLLQHGLVGDPWNH